MADFTEHLCVSHVCIETISTLQSRTSFCLKTLVDDENFCQLEHSFLPSKGRGRRPSPPVVMLNNRLLLQLRVLQQDNGMTPKDVEVWFKKLFPESHFPTNRLGGVLSRAEMKFKSVFDAGGDLALYLNTPLDLDFISDSLEQRGLKLGHLLDKIPLPPDTVASLITHELVIDLEIFRKKEKLPKNFTLKWIRKLSGCTEDDKTLMKSVEQLKTQYDKFIAKKKQDIKSAFLATVFQCTTVRKCAKQPLVQSSSAHTTKALTSSCTICSNLKKEVQQLIEIKIKQETEVSVLKETILDLSKDKVELLQKVTFKENLQGQVEKLQNEIKQLKRNQDPHNITRLKNSLKMWKDAARSKNHTHERLLEMRAEIKSVKNTAMVAKSNYRRALRNAQRRTEHLKEENEQLKHQIQELNADLHRELPKEIYTRTGKNRFTNKIRQTLLQLQSEGNVPASRCSTVIQVVSKHLFDTDIPSKDLPCTQTSINVADEGHVLTKYEAGEKMLQADNYTFHSDGTSRDGNQIVGHQVTLDNGTTLSLGFTTVATEDAQTLLDTTVLLLQEISDIYCAEDEDAKNEVFKQLLSKLSSTMTDRAPVMKCFDKKLQDFISSTLGREVHVHFLHCNAHFLLGVSRACELALKQIEEKICKDSGPLGRDKLPRFARYSKTETATSRLLRLASDVTGPRGDDKNGCRAEWLAHCADNNVRSCMTSYRSNRFNSFFKSAAAIIYHQAHLQNLFDSGRLSHTNGKLESVSADCRDVQLLSLVCAVALLYLKVTGPFWHLLESDTKYTELHLYIQQLDSCFDRWSCDASELLDPNFLGVFGGEFEEVTVMNQAVYAFAAKNSKTVKHAIEDMMRKILITTRTQLSDFLSDGKLATKLSDEDKSQLKHCPLHNLLGENVFGEMDFNMAKSRHASFHHHSTTQMMKHNKTSNWLASKSKEDVDILLSMARKRRRALRQQHQRQQQLVQLKIREQLLENQRQQRLKEARAAAKRTTIIHSIMCHGGPCAHKSDVPKLVKRLRKGGLSENKIRLALLNEIRYQKQVLNQKGTLRLYGTLPQLVNSLVSHLPEAPPHFAIDENESDIEMVDTDSDDLLNSDAVYEKFSFSNQGQWVAVYYDTDFYIGQVIEVKEKDTAVIQFLEKTIGRKDLYRWPRKEDVAEVKRDYIFYWDFEVMPVSSEGRVWKVPEVNKITNDYQHIASLT